MVSYAFFVASLQRNFMNFSHSFKHIRCISLLIPCLLIIQPMDVKSEPMTITTAVAIGVAVNLIASGTIEGLRYFLSKSKNEEEYELRHVLFKDKRMSYFINSLETLKNISDADDAEEVFLTDHELYRYPNFVKAIKKSCPGYAEYIKNLYFELAQNYKKRKVRGFERVYKKNLLTRNLPGNKPEEDNFEFYELIKKLYQEVLEQEQRDQLIALILQGDFATINQLWDSLDKNLLCEVLRTIGCEKNDKAYAVLMNLVGTCGSESAELCKLAATILLTTDPETIDSYKNALFLLEKALALKPDDKEIVMNIQSLKKLIEMTEIEQQVVFV